MRLPVPRPIAWLALLLTAPAHGEPEIEAQAGEVVITATRFEEPRQDIPIGLIVITAEDIERSGAQMLPELLSRQPGITVRNNSGSPDQQVDLRGFGATADQNTLVLVDGERLSENELTTARWSTIPISAIERIEILRGSGAVLYGGGATGGVINIITKGPDPGKRDLDLYTSYGTYDTLDLRAGGAVAGERAGLTLNAERYSSDNYREHNRVTQRNAEVNLKMLAINPGLGLRFGLDDQDLQLPGARTAAQLETDPRGATTPNDFAQRSGGHALLTGRAELGSSELIADVGYRKKDATSSVFFFGSTFLTQTVVDTVSATPRIKIPHQLIAGQSTLVAGFDWTQWNYDSTRDFGPAHVSATQTNRAAYVQNSTLFSTGTVLSIGGRLQEVELNARDEDSGAPYASGEQTSRPRAYEVAVRQDLGQSMSIHGKVGRSFRVANVDEIYNQFGGPFFDPIVTFLEPQTANYQEIDLEASWASLYARASLYHMNLQNEIHFDPTTFSNVNLPPTKRYGVELEGRWRAKRWLELSANYTFAVAKFRSGQIGGADVTGKTVPLVPEHKFNVSAGIDFTSDTRLGLTYSYVGSQFFDGDETNTFGQKIPAYDLIGLRLSHRAGRWLLAGTVSNAFDEKYFTYGLVVPSTFIAYPEPGRALFVSAEYRWP